MEPAQSLASECVSRRVGFSWGRHAPFAGGHASPAPRTPLAQAQLPSGFEAYACAPISGAVAALGSSRGEAGATT